VTMPHQVQSGFGFGLGFRGGARRYFSAFIRSGLEVGVLGLWGGRWGLGLRVQGIFAAADVVRAARLGFGVYRCM